MPEYKSDVFHNIPIKRGQSRGLRSSLLSKFFGSHIDASGQLTNEKIVGYFKGQLCIEDNDKKCIDL